MKKRNVLFLVDKTGFGGVQTIANKLIESKMKGVNMYYFFLRDVDYKFGTKKIKKPNVFYSKCKSRYSINSFFELKNLVKEKNIDIIHMNGNKSILFGILIKIFIPYVKTIAHEHGGKFDDKNLNFISLSLLKKYLDKFIFLSQFRKEKIKKMTGIKEEKTLVLPNFVDLNDFNKKVSRSLINKLKNKYSLNNNVVIGYVGGLYPIKGCDILIRSIPLMKNKNIKCIIIGDGPEKTNLEKLSRELTIMDKVAFLGYQKDVNLIYSLLDVLIIPSRWEAFGIVALEAFSKKVPIICSEEVLKNGFLLDGLNCLSFKKENYLDLAKKMDYLFKDKSLRNHLIANSSKLLNSFIFKNYLKGLIKIYNEI